MSNKDELDEIYRALTVGQRKDMVELIDEQVMYDFWEQWREYLIKYGAIHRHYQEYTDTVISYFRIKSR